MEPTLDTIRTALASEATPEARTAGIAACHEALAALGATPMPTSTPTPSGPSPIEAIAAAIRGVPPEQLLDLAIAKLRSALPAGTEVPAVAPIRFQIVPVTRRG